eukprot:5282926-Alexandrium_andersonii.AAC.1
MCSRRGSALPLAAAPNGACACCRCPRSGGRPGAGPLAVPPLGLAAALVVRGVARHCLVAAALAV